MRVLISTTGSDGDIRPFLAFGRELARRGHAVTFASPDHYASAVAAQGLVFRELGPSWDEAEVRDLFARVLSKRSPLDQIALVMDSIAEAATLVVPQLLALVEEADVVVYPPIAVAAAAAARARGVRHVSVQLAPVHPARAYSPTGVNLGPWLNRLLWALGGRLMARATDAKLNAIVRAAGLDPWRNVLLEASTSTWLDLVAVSPQIMRRDPAWPASSVVTGYFFLDDESPVDPALASFVGEDRPVVVGFGSMHGFDAVAATRAIVEAVRDLPRKVVLLAGWAGLGDGVPLPAHVHRARFVPHGWLLSRAACMVHHGGAGTTAAAFRAGIPHAVVWHLGDQPMWARQAVRLGVSPGFVSHRELSAAWLRRQIDRMLADERMQRAARSIGDAISRENGVATAADVLEDGHRRVTSGSPT